MCEDAGRGFVREIRGGKALDVYWPDGRASRMWLIDPVDGLREDDKRPFRGCALGGDEVEHVGEQHVE